MKVNFYVKIIVMLWSVTIIPGVRIGYNLQLREGLLHSGRVGAGRGVAGDKQEECAQSNRRPGLTAGGQ